VVDDALLDAVDQLLRFAADGDEVEPAAGGVRIDRHADHSAGQDVQPAEIVEKPAVDAVFANCGLNRRQIEHGVSLE